MAKVLFYTATKAQFDALASKNTNALYFLTDTGELFKGSTRFSFPVKQVEGFPVTSPETGIVYVDVSGDGSGEAKIWTGSAWITLGSNKVVIENAVRHVVTAEEAGTGIYADALEGDVGILFTFTSGSQAFFNLKEFVDIYTGVDTNSVDMTVSGYNISADVKISAKAGNLISIISNSGEQGIYASFTEKTYGVEDTHSIDANLSADNKFSGNVKVSAQADNIVVIKSDSNEGVYVKGYTAEDTNSIDATIDADHKVSATLKVSAKAENALSILSDSGEVGVYVEPAVWLTLG